MSAPLPRVPGLVRPRVATPRPGLGTKGKPVLNPFGANKMPVLTMKAASLSEKLRDLRSSTESSGVLSLSEFFRLRELEKAAGLATAVGEATQAVAPRFLRAGQIARSAANAAPRVVRGGNLQGAGEVARDAARAAQRANQRAVAATVPTPTPRPVAPAPATPDYGAAEELARRSLANAARRQAARNTAPAPAAAAAPAPAAAAAPAPAAAAAPAPAAAAAPAPASTRERLQAAMAAKAARTQGAQIRPGNAPDEVIRPGKGSDATSTAATPAGTATPPSITPGQALDVPAAAPSPSSPVQRAMQQQASAATTPPPAAATTPPANAPLPKPSGGNKGAKPVENVSPAPPQTKNFYEAGADKAQKFVTPADRVPQQVVKNPGQTTTPTDEFDASAVLSRIGKMLPVGVAGGLAGYGALRGWGEGQAQVAQSMQQGFNPQTRF
jgi:hypothetical protein